MAIVERIRSLPRARPHPGFRMKITLSALMAPLLPDGWWERPDRERYVMSRPVRRFAVASVALLIAVLCFWGLTGLAMNSTPADALYFLKRARERIELTFTWNPVAKAEMNLEFAQRRLSELDQLVTRQQFNVNDVAALSEDYERAVQAAGGLAERGAKSAEIARVYSRIDELDKQKSDFGRKIEAAAGAGGVLEPARSALVTVSNTPGTSNTGGLVSVSGRADADGKFRFAYKPVRPGAAKDLQATVELDGRKELVPLVAGNGRGATEDRSFEATVSPVVSVVPLGQETSFEVSLGSPTGMEVAGRSVRVTDTTGGGLVNGSPTSSIVVAGADGRCAFDLRKVSINRLSRITIEVFDDGWKSLGEVLTLGALGVGNQNPGAWSENSDGFAIECSPPLENLGGGTCEVTLTIRKQYHKITDYIE